MRLITGLCVLASFGGAAAAQVPAVQRSGPADATRLTRQQAIAEALSHNAQLEVAREQTNEARARRVSGTAFPDPGLSAAFDQLSSPITFGSTASRPVSVGLTIPYFDKFRLNGKIGDADIRNFESNYQLQRQLIAFATSTAYDSLLVAQRHYAEQQQTLQLTQDFQKRTQARLDLGAVPKFDVIKANVAVAQSQNDLVAAERGVSVAQASLNRQLGRIIAAPIAPADSLDVPPPLPDSSTIETVALANRSELRQLEAQRAGATASTALSKEFWRPDLTFSVQKDYAQPGPTLFTTGIALPIPLLYGQHARGDIAQAEHFERELAATYRDARAQVTQDVRQAYATASTTIRQVVFLRDQLLPATQEAFRVASISYNLGGASALDVLSARTDLIAAQAQLSDALGAANTAYADLQRALGIPLPQIGPPAP